MYNGSSESFASGSKSALGKFGARTTFQLPKVNRLQSLKRTHGNQEFSTEKYGFKRTTIRQFLQLSTEEPNTIAIELFHDLKSFQKVILNSERVGENDGDMLKIINILVKLTMVCDTEERKVAVRILAETFNSRSFAFCIKLQQYVQKTDSERDLLAVVRLFDSVLKILPSSWELLPMECLKLSVVGCMPEITNEEVYLSMIGRYQDAQQNAVVQNGDALLSSEQFYNEYRHLSILPNTCEVNENVFPQLNASIIEGCYDSWAHYYDTQFKLLKEDFVAPLRRGVCGFREGFRGRDISDVRVYHKVSFTGLSFSSDGILLSVKFDSSKFRVNWEHSKRLIYGSLLCFSNDNFETIIFASVVSRDASKLELLELTVKMESDADILYLASNKDDLYIMIESQAHYETYYHVLNSLQKAECSTMPFTEILIESKCQEVQPPAYMCLTTPSVINHPQLVFNMKRTLGISKEYRLFHSFDVTRPECWPSVEHVQLDESQLEAMKMALTQKVSVIQGPPGTGKTYIGMKIVQALLINRHVWDPARNSPLLVVCYTNHALDQFLEGIIDMNNCDKSIVESCHRSYDDNETRDSDDNDAGYSSYTAKNISIVRVGSRCQNEKVEKFSIKNLRRNYHSAATQNIKEKVGRAGTELDRDFKIIQKKVDPTMHSIVEFISADHLAQLRSLVDKSDKMHYHNVIVHGIELWLSGKDLEKPVTTDDNDNYDNDSSESEYDDNNETIESESAVTAANEHSLLDDVSVVSIMGDIESNEDDKIQHQKLSGKDKSDIVNKSTEVELSNEKLDGMEAGSIEATGDEDTVHVVGEAELAMDQRMIDNPAEVFHYEDTNSNNSMIMTKIENENVTSPTGELTSFPKGPFTYATVNQIDNIFQLTKHDRHKLCEYWKRKYIDKVYNELGANFEDYLVLCNQCKKATQEEDFYVLEKVDLIGMTTTGAAKYQHIIQRVKPKIVVVEEAAEVLESHIVSCLTAATQQLILIGDHKQLRPNPNEYYLARQYNLDISLFERLITVGIPHATLEIQHRMRPEIAGLVCPYIYPKLLNHESVLIYEDVRGVTTNMHFFDHQYPEQENDDLRSHCNEEEAKLVVGLCKYFLEQDFSPSQITVLTTYTGQLLKLKSLMPRKIFDGVRITAVDNFQGEENDIIILSLVRSNKKGNVGFLSIQNRICVALSRAKKGFYCFGNFALLRKSCDTWDAIVSYLEQRDKLGSLLLLRSCSEHSDMEFEIRTAADFKKVPKGGCSHHCDVRLDCGHVCKCYCHARDPSHDNYDCTEPCTKTCANGHQCPELCHISCPKCEVEVEKVMPVCGHTQNFPCYTEPEFRCEAPCTRICDNGHPCTNKCGDDCPPCNIIVEKVIPTCGHTQDVPCYQDASSFKCKTPCTKTCSSGHPCPDFCYKTCSPCNIMVEKVLLKCGHIQSVPCYLEEELIKCKAPCDKLCKNGHLCRNFCYETCLCQVSVEKVIPNCGHTQNVPCYLEPKLFRCKAPCIKKCPEGHLCPKHCSEFCGRCQTIVEKLHPKCGHLQSIFCHQDPRFCKCQHPCEEVCSTNPTDPHKCAKLCSQPCGNCMVPILKTLPRCGHEHSFPCYLLPDYYSCPSPCKRKLRCGHICTNKCGKPCNTRCKLKVEKTFPGCGHTLGLRCDIDINIVKCQVEVTKHFASCEHTTVLQCSESVDESSCQEIVQRLLPCGHKRVMKCSQSILDFKCKIHVKKVLKCGHIFEGKCYNASKCPKLTVKTLPACGHKIKLPCFKDVLPKCTVKCTTKLLCGHQCTGNCGDCYQGRMHKPCSFHVYSLPCGHPANAKDSCISIMYPNCHYKCEYFCAHRKACTHRCSQPCNPCEKPCSWSCQHYQCSKKCHEFCDRPRCDHPCKLRLKCKHPCIGICGEPCPQACRLCKKRQFQNLCVDAPDMRNETRYVQLSCKHLFEVRRLDQLLDKQFKDSTVIQPLYCPSCRRQIHGSCRYGDMIKTRKEMIERSHAIMKENVSTEQRDAVIEKIHSNFPPGKRQQLPYVFRMLTKTMVASTPLLLGSLNVIENEIDQYISLEKCLPLCEQFPDLLVRLQELTAFFEKTSPSVQKHYDVSCEKQRILLLWMILGLRSVISVHKDAIVLNGLEENLNSNWPKLTLAAAANHYDELLKVAKKTKHTIEIDAEHLQPIRAVFLSGVWIICPQNHVYCVPRTVFDDEKNLFLCPDCAK